MEVAAKVAVDTDGDGIPDFTIVDTNGDGFYDPDLWGGPDATTEVDTDLDIHRLVSLDCSFCFTGFLRK